MTATTMHFGPEWMRTKHQPPARPQPPPSPPPAAAPPSASTYSALVSPAPPSQPEKRDETHPFRYSKEEMLRIFREGGGKGGLGLEVERWEGVVREVGSEPVGLREMGEAERKLFAGPLNSELRRRQSSDYLSPLSTQNLGSERPRLNHSTSATGSPLRERFGGLARRRDSTDSAPLAIPRKLSLSSMQGVSTSPRDMGLPSPRGRGFDGVLNGGETWMSRRRASEGLLKSTNGVTPRGELGGDLQSDSKAPEIREEDEDGPSNEVDLEASDRPLTHQPSPPPQPESSLGGVPNESMSSDQRALDAIAIHPVSASDDQSVLGSNISSSIPTSDGPPPGIDLASVEWSYLDPQGQIQGPFRADLMQKWYNDGYFTPDLLMKRTHVDNDWVEVGELARRSGGDKIFLSLPVQSLAPPGLARPSETPLQNFAAPMDQNSFNAPYQPAPLRTLRTSALDSYLGTGSNPSDSPSSSFGAGRFGNGSPDPAAFGGRSGNTYLNTDTLAGGRIAGYSAAPESPSTFSSVRRNTFNDPSVDPSIRSPSFTNIASTRTSTLDNYGFNGTYSPVQPPWQPSGNPIASGFDGMSTGRSSADSLGQYPNNYGPNSHVGPSGLSQTTTFANIRGPHDAPFQDTNGPGKFPVSDYITIGDGPSQRDVQIPGRGVPNDKLSYNNFNGLDSMPYGNGQFPHYPTSQQPAPSFAQLGSAPRPIPSNQQHAPSHLPTSNATNAQTLWSTPDPNAIRRPGPFDAPHPTTNNTLLNPTTAPSQPSPWGRTNQNQKPAPAATEPSPWFAASQGPIDENWREVGPNSLTFSNVGQHNQQQQQQQSLAPPVAEAIVPQTLEHPKPPPPGPPSPEVTPAAPMVPSPAAPAPKTRTKSTAQPPSAPTLLAKPAAPVSQPVVKSPSPPPTARPAWVNDEEQKKSKPSGVSLSLREIQDAEAKKAEARKVAERERERARAAAQPSAAEEAQPFTASWGLPTSQAGVRGNAPSPIGSSSSPATAVAPVWTTGAKPPTVKKTMKEIQEEEERRKKLAAKETTAAAARRAYAETTNKATPPVAGAAWTTVGPSGKTTPGAAAPVRPPITPSTSATLSTTASVPRVNGAAAARPVATPAAVKPPPPKVEEPVTPSHDFLKWLNDSLKGLNSSVNVEEIMSMLLLFPMDPDASTTEIISDLIYANSTTLDGRRFAAEFVGKRKADAASRRKGAGTAGTVPGKPVSIADVVKAQPKPTQPEWGGFKVVNKKKKGGRA